MRSERETAEQTAPARVRKERGGVERDAGMTYYSSRHSVGDRLPRWICLTPEPGKMGRNTGKTAAGCQNIPPPRGAGQIIYCKQKIICHNSDEMIVLMLQMLKKKKKVPDVEVKWVELQQRFCSEARCCDAHADLATHVRSAWNWCGNRCAW